MFGTSIACLFDKRINKIFFLARINLTNEKRFETCKIIVIRVSLVWFLN